KCGRRECAGHGTGGHFGAIFPADPLHGAGGDATQDGMTPAALLARTEAMIRDTSILARVAAFRHPAAHGPALAALALCGLLSGPAMAQALGGMDPVSLRDAGRPVGGDAAISTHWKGREWRFSNDANRAAFEANP